MQIVISVSFTNKTINLGDYYYTLLNPADHPYLKQTRCAINKNITLLVICSYEKPTSAEVMCFRDRFRSQDDSGKLDSKLTGN